METMKKGTRVYVLRGTNVEKGTITSVFVGKSSTTYRVRWGKEPWGGILPFDACEVYRFEDDACLALANRLTRIASGLVHRAKEVEWRCGARRRIAAASAK